MKKVFATILAIGIIAALSVFATGNDIYPGDIPAEFGDAKLQQKVSFFEKGFALGVSISNFNSTSHEYVYDDNGSGGTGRKLSELIWKAKNINLLGLGLEYSFSNGFALFANYKRNMGDSDGTIDDYDWLDNNIPHTWTEWSGHNTDVTKLEIIDIGLKYNIKLSKNNPDIGLMVGYKQEQQDFEAYGGDYIYSDVGFRDDIGSLPADEHVFTYKQKYSGIYLGASIAKTVEKIGINAEIRYSPFMQPDYIDYHYGRSLIFTNYYENTTMFTYKIDASYYVNTQNTFSLEYEYTKYDHKVGNTMMIDSTTGQTDFYPGCEGLESKNSLLKLSYNYRF
jgi:outer membrane protease